MAWPGVAWCGLRWLIWQAGSFLQYKLNDKAILEEGCSLSIFCSFSLQQFYLHGQSFLKKHGLNSFSRSLKKNTQNVKTCKNRNKYLN